MKKYETIVIFKSEVTTEDVDSVAKKLEKIMNKKPGKFLKKDDWGIKKFAYPIEKLHEGRYVFWYFENTPEVMKEIDKTLRFDESILRYSTMLTVEPLEGTEFGNKKTLKSRGGKRIHVDYKEPLTVTKYLTERGKIVPRRVTGVDARTQKRISQAVKRARQFALLSFTDGLYVQRDKASFDKSSQA